MTQTECVKRLNKELPKELMPRSGKITTANFSMKVRNGQISVSKTEGKKRYYDWAEVAASYGISPTKKDDTIKRATDRAKDMAEGLDSEIEKIVEDFTNTLASRLSRATTAKQEIEIEKMSYDALSKQLEAKKQLEALIDVDEAKATLEYILGNVKAKVYELPSKIRTRFPKMEDEEIVEISTMIDEIFKGLSSGEVF